MKKKKKHEAADELALPPHLPNNLSSGLIFDDDIASLKDPSSPISLAVVDEFILSLKQKKNYARLLQNGRLRVSNCFVQFNGLGKANPCSEYGASPLCLQSLLEGRHQSRVTTTLIPVLCKDHFVCLRVTLCQASPGGRRLYRCQWMDSMMRYRAGTGSRSLPLPKEFKSRLEWVQPTIATPTQATNECGVYVCQFIEKHVTSSLLDTDYQRMPFRMENATGFRLEMCGAVESAVRQRSDEDGDEETVVQQC